MADQYTFHQDHAYAPGGFFGVNTINPAGGTSAEVGQEAEQPINRRVFVVHGRDGETRRAMFDFVRALGLEPLEWESLVSGTKQAAPHVLEVVRHGLASAAAVVVLVTPDDFAFLHESLQQGRDLWYERSPAGQARPNVLFEAGMAMALFPGRTILVQLGWTRPFTDTDGLDWVLLDGSVEKLKNVAHRLRTAGCPVNTDGDDWMDVTRFADLAAMRRGL
jgi:hypothetical protein